MTPRDPFKTCPGQNGTCSSLINSDRLTLCARCRAHSTSAPPPAAGAGGPLAEGPGRRGFLGPPPAPNFTKGDAQ